jgi:hypothetical protein
VQVIIAVVAALISGLAATWYQLRRQRARPYAVAQAYTRELFGDQAMVTVPAAVAGQLSLSVYLAGYSAVVAQLSSVREAAQACAELQALGPPLLDAVAEVVTAIERGDDDSRLKGALRSPLRMPFFDKFLMAAANGRALADNEELARQNEQSAALLRQWEQTGKQAAQVPMFPSPADGSYQFGFPGRPIVVGRDLKKWPIAAQELAPLFQAIRFLDRPLLRESFERLAALLTADLKIAAETIPDLSGLLAEHFRCVCRLYLANYGAAPAMIQATGAIQVRRSRADRSPLAISCQLAALADDGRIARTENGFLLSAGAEIRIGFVSEAEQRDSANVRDALRAAAEKPCEVRAEFACVSSAWPGTKTVRSRWAPSAFSEPVRYQDQDITASLGR